MYYDNNKNFKFEHILYDSLTEYQYREKLEKREHDAKMKYWQEIYNYRMGGENCCQNCKFHEYSNKLNTFFCNSYGLYRELYYFKPDPKYVCDCQEKKE